MLQKSLETYCRYLGVWSIAKKIPFIYIITFTIIYMKNVFRDDVIRDDLEMVWNEIQIKVKKS